MIKRAFILLIGLALLSLVTSPEAYALSVSRNPSWTDGTSMETYVDAAQVASANDLESYARSALYADDNLQSITFNRDSVEVKYKEEGKFLALVPVSLTLKATAYPTGGVAVAYPWYSFLTVTKREKIESEMKIAVDGALRLGLVGSVKAYGSSTDPMFTASVSAQVADAVEHVLRSNVGSEASTSLEMGM